MEAACFSDLLKLLVFTKHRNLLLFMTHKIKYIKLHPSRKINLAQSLWDDFSSEWLYKRIIAQY